MTGVATFRTALTGEPAMTRARPARQAATLLTFAAGLLLAGGCGSWQVEQSYGRIVLGQTSAENAARLMPKPVNAGPAGLVHYKHDRSMGQDRHQALVLLLAGTGQVQGRMRATVQLRRWGNRLRRSAEFEAELPGRFAPTDQAGPVGALRTALDYLSRRPFDRAAIQAQALLAAAVIRTLSAVPDVHTSQHQQQRYAAQLEMIPPNGYYQVSRASAETFRIYYRSADTTR